MKLARNKIILILMSGSAGVVLGVSSILVTQNYSNQLIKFASAGFAPLSWTKPGRQEKAQKKELQTATVQISGEPSIGNPKAPMILVEFSDYECPYCKDFHLNTLPKIKKEFIDSNQLLFVHKDLPLPFHKNAFKAAKIARCAFKNDPQDFWTINNYFFSQQQCLSCKGPNQLGEEANTNKPIKAKCGNNKKINTTINANISEASINNIKATPTFVLGKRTGDTLTGTKIEGSLPWERFSVLIQQHIDSIDATQPHGK